MVAFLVVALALQVYKGLDVCSAKVTAEEQTQAKHHLLSVAECTDNYNVVTFRDTALPIVSCYLTRASLFTVYWAQDHIDNS